MADNNGNTPNPSDLAFKAMQDARAKLKAAGVDYYLIVARDGYTADDGSIQTENAPSVIQRLELVSSKLRREHPEIRRAAE